jgi:hypothetical protein
MDGMGTRLYVSRDFRSEWEEKVAGWSEAECKGFIKRMRAYPPDAWTVKVRWVYGLVMRRAERASQQENCRTYWEEREMEVGREKVREERGAKKWAEPRWKEEREVRRREYEQRLAEEKQAVEASWTKPRS